MDKSIELRAIALLTTSNEQVSKAEDGQTIIRDYAALNKMEIVSFLALELKNLGLGLRHAIDLARAKYSTTIIVDDITTLMMPPQELIDAIDCLIQNDLTLAFGKNRTSFDKASLTTLRDLMVLTKKAEGVERSNRIKNSLRLRKQGGQRVGGRKFGFGLNEASIIDQILTLHAEGKSLQGICQALELSETKTVHNKTWHPTTIKRIIERSFIKAP